MSTTRLQFATRRRARGLGFGGGWSGSVEMALYVAFALLVLNNVVVSSAPVVAAFHAADAVGRAAVVVGVGALVTAAAWILFRSLSILLVLATAAVVTGTQVVYVLSPHQPGLLPHAWWATQVVIPACVLVVGTLRPKASIPALVALLAAYFLVRLSPQTGPGHGAAAASSELSLVLMVSSMILFIVPLCRRTALLADLVADRRAEADQVADAAAAADRVRRSAARLLHDEVIHALRAVSLPPGAINAVVVRRLAGAAATLLRQGLTAPGRDGRSPVPGIAAAAELATVTVDLTVEGEAAVPAHVAEALAGAVGEALRNVHRHAGVDTATVLVRTSKSAVHVEVADRGAGFTAAGSRFETLGVGSSIIGRIADIGGAVSITSSQGTGTVVRLTWPAPAAGAAAVTTPGQLLDVAGTRTGMLWAVCVPQLVFSLVQDGLHHGDVGSPGWVFAGLLLVTVATFGSVALLMRRSMQWWMSLMLGVSAVGVVVAGGWTLRSTAQLDVSYFAAGAGAPAVCLMALFRPICESMVTAAVVFVAVVAMVLRVGGEWSAVGRALPAVTSGVIAVGAVLCVRLMLQAMGRDLWRDNEVRRQTTSLQAQLAVRESVIAGRLERVGQWTLPFLAGIADGSYDLHQPRVRQRASVLEAMVRDDIHLGTALDGQARSLIAACREAGGEVQFNAEPDGPDLPGPLLTAAIVTALSGPAPEQLVVSLSPAPTADPPATATATATEQLVTISLFIKPPQAQRALEALVEPLGGTVLRGPDFLLVQVSGSAVSPEKGTTADVNHLVESSR